MMAQRAHSSMAEQPAHNRLDLGSSPGGPTVVAGAARPAYSAGGLPQVRGAARPAYSAGGLPQVRGAARPAYSVGGLPQVRMAPVRGQSEGVWIHSFLR